jgi:Tfp pilus assembly protein PilF
VLISGKLAIQLFPEEPMAFLLSASVLYGKKQYLPAIEILQRAVPISENSRVEGNILSLLAECYGRTGQYVMSDNMYENATKVDSTDVVVLNNYAYSLAERSVLLDKAESMSRKAIEGDPGNGTYLDTYGWVLFKQGRYVEAKKYIKQAIKLEGESNPEILSHMGDIYDKLNSNSKADKYWTKALFFAEEEMKIVLKEKLSKSKGR